MAESNRRKRKTKNKVEVDISEYLDIQNKKKEKEAKKKKTSVLSEDKNKKKSMLNTGSILIKKPKTPQTTQVKKPKIPKIPKINITRTLVVLIISSLVLFVGLTILLNRYTQYLGQQNRYEELQVDLSEAKKQKDTYNLILERIDEDSEYLKDIAREKYNLSEEGELTIVYDNTTE